ncbi:DUF3017 domain-containing protein [Nocardioides scoriae]|uniref:DUF3017 domain-containing protein n=1 Tax=Nocardioides scoriae TaxID=642780 RepID=UPI0012F83EA2|nr:DUF3017 domain-containing protein [Nocardioides scoriae]
MSVEREPRRVPSTLGGLVYLVVVGVSAVGMLLVAFGPWRRGVSLIGFALLAAAAMRAVLSEHEAGMLRVRRYRWIDVGMLAGVGVALVVLSSVIPDQPG